jgi:hypothetical protein
MKNILYLLLIAALTGCGTEGLTTYYKTREPVSLHAIGFVDLSNDSSLAKVFPPTNDIFKQTVPEAFENKGMKGVQHMPYLFNFDNPDVGTIKNVCQQNNLDAILISHLRFINVAVRRYYRMGQVQHHTEVAMKLYDKSGNLLYNITYNTYYGNTYNTRPTAKMTIQDGTRGAINAIMDYLYPPKKTKKDYNDPY